MPTYGGSPVYDVVFGPVARLGIFWLLLGVKIGVIAEYGSERVARTTYVEVVVAA